MSKARDLALPFHPTVGNSAYNSACRMYLDSISGRITQDGTKETTQVRLLLCVRDVRSDKAPEEHGKHVTPQSFCMYVHVHILPLSDKSGRLCLYERLTVPDLIFDVFLDSSAVFLVGSTYLFCGLLSNYATERPEKYQSAQK